MALDLSAFTSKPNIITGFNVRQPINSGLDLSAFGIKQPEKQVKTVNFPSDLGGGSFKVGQPGELVKTERDYAGIEAPGQYREHIFPVALGGTSDFDNIKVYGKDLGKKKSDYENQIIRQYKNGDIDLGEARGLVLQKYRELTGLDPKQGWQNYVLPALKETILNPIETTKKLFSTAQGTTQAFKDLFSSLDPRVSETFLKDTVVDFKNTIVEQMKTAGDKVAEAFMQEEGETKAEKIGQGLEATAATVGVLLSPITAFFEAGKNIPMLKTGIAVVNLPFAVAGDIGKNVSGEIIEALPISQADKEAIKQGAEEIGSLAAQIVAGGALNKSMRSKKIAELEKKYSKKDAETIVKKAEEQAIMEKSITKAKPDIIKIGEKEINISALKEKPKTVKGLKPVEKPIETITKLAPKEVKALNKFDRANYRLAENLPPLEEGKIRIYQTGAKNTGIIEKGSYVDTRLTEHIARGLSSEKKIFKDITPTELKKNFRETKPGIYQAKTEIPGEIYNDFAKAIEYKPIEPETVRPVGNKVAGVAKSIEAKALEQGLVEGGFDSLASFERTTIKDQAKITSKLLKEDFNKARGMIRGEQPLPEGLNGISLVKAMEDVVKKTGDADLAYELANSPLTEAVSLAAQELSLTRGRTLDSATARIQRVKKAREAKAKKALEKKKEIKKEIKKETEKVNLSKEELKWESFLEKIAC